MSEEQKKIELKPCPFCGADAYIDCTTEPHVHVFVNWPEHKYYQTFICCSKCSAGLSGNESATEKEAIKSAVEIWNTRADALTAEQKEIKR